MDEEVSDEQWSDEQWSVIHSAGHVAYTFIGQELRLAPVAAIATLTDHTVGLTYAPVWLLLVVEGVEEARHWLELGVEVFWTEGEATKHK